MSAARGGAASSAARRALIPPAATAWGYVRHELLYLCFALMEVSLLTPMALVILGWARYWPAGLVLLWLLLLMLVPLNLVRLMSLLRVGVRRQRRVMIVALLLVVVVSWRSLLYTPSGLFDFGWLRQFMANLAEGSSLVWVRDLSVFLLTVFVWWRGIRLAMRQPEIGNVGLRLRLGGLILAPLVAWFSISFLNISVVPFLLLFFLAGLTAAALVRAENIEQEQRGTAATLNARWFAVVGGAAVITVALGAVGAAFLSGDSLLVVAGWLSPLWLALQFGGAVVGVVLFQLTYPLFQVLALLVNALGRVLTAAMGPVAAVLAQMGLLEEEATLAIPTPPPEAAGPLGEVAGKAGTVALMLGLIIVVALALARVYQRAALAARDSSPSLARQDAGAPPGAARRLLERLGLAGRWRAAASIRRVYRQMCRAAADAGYPRLEAETPYEYLPSLARAWPDHAAETRLVTEAFVRVRYGELPETAEELEAILSAWQRLEAAGPQRGEMPIEAPSLARRE
jgi:hypothetical protein